WRDYSGAPWMPGRACTRRAVQPGSGGCTPAPGVGAASAAAGGTARWTPSRRNGQNARLQPSTPGSRLSHREGRSWHPHVTVATVVVAGGRLLCVEEHGRDGLVLNQPAGHLEPDESLEQAALRETLEETG